MDLEVNQIHTEVRIRLCNRKTIQVQHVKNKVLLYGTEEKPPVVFSFLSAVQVIFYKLFMVYENV